MNTQLADCSMLHAPIKRIVAVTTLAGFLLVGLTAANALLRVAGNDQLAAVTAGQQQNTAGGNEYHIGAYYFGFWSDTQPRFWYEPDTWEKLAKDTYGPLYPSPFTWDSWMGVRDITEKKYPNGFPWQWKSNDSDPLKNPLHRKPLIGYYDQSDPEVIERQVEMAKSYGLEYFTFYWYWQIDHPVLNAALDNFIASSKTKDFKFNVAVCAPYAATMMPESSFDEVTDTLVGYMKQPNYLRAPDGKPIIEVCHFGAIGLSPSEYQNYPGSAVQEVRVKTFLTMLRDKAQEAGIGPIRLQFRAEAWENFAPKEKLSSIATHLVPYFDGASCLTAGMWNANPPNYGTYATGLYASLNALQSKYGKPLTACVIQNFDERPRWGLMYEVGTHNFTKMYDHSRSNFELALKNAKKWMDANDHLTSKYMTIYAWNEFHEGGILEPTVKDGAAYLNLVKSVFNLKPSSAPPEPTCSLTASPIDADGMSTLSWTTAHASAVSINNGIGLTTESGTYDVSPAQSTAYTLTVNGPGGTKTCMVHVGAAPVDGYDIIIVGGQSNAVGSGLGAFYDPEEDPTVDAKIFQLGRRGTDNGEIIPATWTQSGKTYDALQHVAVASDRETMGFAIPFARRYVEEQLEPDRAVLIVPAARGGSSITQWVDGSLSLYTDMRNRIIIAKNKPGDNKIVAFLWHQGETDTSLAVNKPQDMNPSVYQNKLTELLKDFREEFDSDGDVPLLGGKFVPSWNWWTTNIKADMENAIVNAFADVPGGRAGVVSSVNLKSNFEAYPISGGLQAVHFTSASLVTLGERYYNNWKYLEDAPSTEPSCSSFTASPDSISVGQSTTLSWETEHATAVSINHDIGSVTPVSSGSVTASPTETTTYVLFVANGSGGEPACSTTVTVTSPHTMTYEEVLNGDDASISRTPNSHWYHQTQSVYSNNYNSDDDVSTTKGDSAYISTTDTVRYEIRGNTGPARGTMWIFIDGQPQKLVDLYSATLSDSKTLYTSPNLTPGNHTLRIINQSDSVVRHYVGIDSIVVTKASN